MEITKYEPGCFCWADLATTDGEGAKKFYTTILGLDSVEMPMGENMGMYVMLQKGGRNVAALYEMTPEMQAEMPFPHWRTYINVEDAEATIGKVAGIGRQCADGSHGRVRCG